MCPKEMLSPTKVPASKAMVHQIQEVVSVVALTLTLTLSMCPKEMLSPTKVPASKAVVVGKRPVLLEP
jgi:hypothetical protein